MEGRKAPVCFYVFDLLQLEGQKPAQASADRAERIAGQNLRRTSAIRFVTRARSAAMRNRCLAEVKRRGLEGIIGKHRDSVYEPGRRSGAWIKLKCVNEQEFVIGGYTPPGGSRKHFGAILVGYYKGNVCSLPAKSDPDSRQSHCRSCTRNFRSEERDDCPFADLPSKQGGQWVQGITPSMMRKMHWVNPVFVAQIKFAEWTRDGKLRQPVFLGLREDKNAREVRVER